MEYKDDTKRFSKLKKIGSGTYGVVYSAYDSELKKNIAIKKIKLEGEDEPIPSTTLRELSLLQELTHPNIVKLLDIVCEEEKLLLVFDLCRTDLKNYIYDENSKNKIPMKTVRKMMHELLDSICF
jgi:serine/threonine protein kinase